jgi:hypothetical protein
MRVLLRIEITPSVTYSKVVNIRPGGNFFLKSAVAVYAAATSSVASKSVRGTAPTPGEVAPASR